MVGRQWTVVVPVKSLTLAKSRLAVPANWRRDLALAFALDTVAAICSSPLVVGVLVVTADPDVERCLRGRSVRVVGDDGSGLQAAVHGGCRAASTRVPAAWVAVIPADLPSLRGEDVTKCLVAGQKTSGGAFVPDRDARGTTMLMCAPGQVVRSRYGPSSASQHRALGFRCLDDAPVRARHDVDTLQDLRRAAALGVGSQTTVVLRSLDELGSHGSWAVGQHVPSEATRRAASP